VTRWTGAWLSGPQAAQRRDGRPGQHWRGERLGLPESGPNSVSSTGRRAVALLLDALLSAGVAGLFTYPELPRNWSLLAWFGISLIGVGVFGFTPGMALLGIRVARLDGTALVGLPRAALRALMVFLIVPAVIWDTDNRGLHDRATGTVVVRTR
jgi:uncharacterized RDD family membrane protein YckC